MKFECDGSFSRKVAGEFQRQLAARGYDGLRVSELRPLDLSSGEKSVYSISDDKIMLYSKRSSTGEWLWNFEQEREVFQELQHRPHGHIVRVFDIFLPNGIVGPAMIMEKIKPMGFDLFQQTLQYMFAKRIVPFDLWKCQLRQLISALKHLHSLQYVHCDVKPENVLVKADFTIKLCDFGLTRRKGSAPPNDVMAYMPPEFLRKEAVDFHGDSWGLGTTMYVIFFKRTITTRKLADELGNDFQGWVRDAGFEEINEKVVWWIHNLFRNCTSTRWSMNDLEKEVPAENDLGGQENDTSSWLATVPSGEQSEPRLFRKSHQLHPPVLGFGYHVTKNSSWFGKFIGPHRNKSNTDWVVPPGDERLLNLGERGVLVLFIDRQAGSIDIPQASDQLLEDDWLFVVSNRTAWAEEHGLTEQKARALVDHFPDKSTISMFIEFDEFDIPSELDGAIVGPPMKEKPDQKALDLRNRFKINLLGVRRSNGKVEYPVDRLTELRAGDVGLVCRVPNRHTGRSRSTLSDEALKNLFHAYCPEIIVADKHLHSQEDVQQAEQETKRRKTG